MDRGHAVKIIEEAERSRVERLERLRCPGCGGDLQTSATDTALTCVRCSTVYPVHDGVARLINWDKTSPDQRKVSQWWDDLCRQWYIDLDQRLTSERLPPLLDELEELYRGMDHLVLSMDLPALKGKKILDIGCGGGAQDALFCRYGADVSAVDISAERAMSSGFKMKLISPHASFAAQADGEKLPFKDGSFDIVYSNGVMHHSESPETMLAEACRVLRPGGRIVMMLYSKVSLQYVSHFLVHGLLLGNLFRYGRKYWLGACTEGRPKFGSVRNPFTRAYTQKEVRVLLKNFTHIQLAKTECHLHAIPFLGRRLRRWLCRLLRQKFYGESMRLIEGRPDYGAYLPVERMLGKSLGWFWNITAEKPFEPTFRA